MRNIYEKLFGNKHKKEPLFEIRRHSFDYSEGRGKRKSRKRREMSRLLSKILSYRITKKRLRNSAVVIMSITVVLSIGIVYNLSVENIDITRENSLIDINQSYRSLDYLRGRNLLSIQKDQVLQRLQNTQGVIRDIRLRKIFPNTLSITIESFTPLYSSNVGLIMENGYVHSDLISGDSSIETLDIEGFEPQLLDTGPDISLRDLYALYVLDQKLTQNIYHIDVVGKKYYIQERELHILDSFDTIYIFDLSENIEHQIEKLSVYITELGNETTENMVYLDLRVPRGVFQCPLENERLCTRNLTNLYGDTVFEFSGNNENKEDNTDGQQE